jgi:hypothetical protein
VAAQRKRRISPTPLVEITIDGAILDVIEKSRSSEEISENESVKDRSFRSSQFDDILLIQTERFPVRCPHLNESEPMKNIEEQEARCQGDYDQQF